MINAGTNTVVGQPISLTAGIPDGLSSPSGVALSRDGRRLYVADSGIGGITVVDTTTGAVVDRIPIGTQLVGVAVSADGSRLFIPDSNGDTRVIDATTHEVLAVIQTYGNAGFVTVSPDGKRAYVTQTAGGPGPVSVSGVAVIDTTTNTLVGNPIPLSASGFEDTPYSSAATPDGKRLYVTERDAGTVSVIDTVSRTVVGSPIPVGGAPTGIAVSPDGSLAMVTNSADGTVSLIDTKTNTVIGNPLNVGTSPYAVVFAPDGRHAYVAMPGDDAVSVISIFPTQAPPVISAPTPVGTPNPATGATTFTVAVAAKPDGTPPTFTVSQPAGVLGVITTGTPAQNADGTYTYTVSYTPDPQDRLDAYTTPGPDR